MRYYLFYICCLTLNCMKMKEEIEHEMVTPEGEGNIKEKMINKDDQKNKKFECLPFYLVESDKMIWYLNGINSDNEYSLNFGKNTVKLRSDYFNTDSCQFSNEKQHIIVQINMEKFMFQKILLTINKTISVEMCYAPVTNASSIKEHNETLKKKEELQYIEKLHVSSHILIQPTSSCFMQCLSSLPCFKKWRSIEYETEYALKMKETQKQGYTIGEKNFELDDEELPYNEIIYEEMSKFSDGVLPPVQRAIEIK